MSALAPEERETCLNMTGDNHELWFIFSDDPYWVRRLQKAGATLVSKDGAGHQFSLPASQVTIRKQRKLSATAHAQKPV